MRRIANLLASLTYRSLRATVAGSFSPLGVASWAFYGLGVAAAFYVLDGGAAWCAAVCVKCLSWAVYAFAIKSAL